MFKGTNFLETRMKQEMVFNLLILCFCVQVTQSDEIYVNREARKVDNGNIEILSFTAQSSETAEETGIHNKGISIENEASDEKDGSEETLTPGDLMAFAWQISQGMVRHFQVIYQTRKTVFDHISKHREEC